MSNYFGEEDRNSAINKNIFIDKTKGYYQTIVSYRTNLNFYFGMKYSEPSLEIIRLYSKLKHSKEINMTIEEFDKFLLDKINIFTALKNKIK